MPKVSKLMCLLVFGAAIVAGCASMHKPTDEEMIQSTVQTVKVALETKDIDKLMTTFSENFKNPRVGGKAEAKALLGQGLNSGYAEGGKVSLSGMKLTLGADNKTAKVYPLELSSNQGSVSAELDLTKEKDGWFITSVSVDGV